MKKILLISDTHSYLDPKLIKHINSSDEVWHAGDIGDVSLCDELEKHKNVKAVFGNIDDNNIRSKYPENLFFNCEQVKVFITHIGGYPGKYSSRIKNILLENKPNLFICGHSHILKVIFDKEFNLLHINPGACGNNGFHIIKTAIKFEIDNEEIKNLSIIELGNRNTIV